MNPAKTSSSNTPAAFLILFKYLIGNGLRISKNLKSKNEIIYSEISSLQKINDID